MPLGKLFGKGGSNDEPDNAPPTGEPLLDSVHAAAEGFPSHAVATVRCERIAEREGPILVSELSEVAKARDCRLAIDLTEVMMISSAGIGSLVQLHRACAEHRGKLVLFGISEEMLAMLKVARLDKLFTIKSKRDDAIGALT
ncbi:MAG: STAS domain-containing protein [Phycisphaerales bacterium JB059]